MPYQAVKIIDSANNKFLENSLSKNKFEADQSLKFLQSQLVDIKNRLTQKEKQLNEVKAKNTSIDLEFEIKAMIERSVTIEKSIKEIELEISKSKYLYEETNPIYVSSGKDKDQLKIEFLHPGII